MDESQHSGEREQISDHSAAPECLPGAGEDSSHAIKISKSGLRVSDECQQRGSAINYSRGGHLFNLKGHFGF